MDPQVGEWDPHGGTQVHMYIYHSSRCSLSIPIQTNLSFHSLHLESNHKLVYNEISTAGFESLISDYKQETEGKTGMHCFYGGRSNPLRADREWKWISNNHMRLPHHALSFR
jgi:hypothetical protein